MKKFIFSAMTLCFTAFAALAQHDHSKHQEQNTTAKQDTANNTTAIDPMSKWQLSQLLASYYNVKNALVSGDATSAASNAGHFQKTVNAIDFKVISEGNIHILAKDAGRISESRDLKKQREYFASLSTNMAMVAKAFKISDQPVYLQYCPMKKASWLSSEKEIKNPYYGSTMLTCGELTETY